MKFLKVIFINLLVIFFLLCTMELILYIDNKKKVPNEKYHIGKIPYKDLFLPERLRAPSGLEYSSRPIMIFGCSFAYGRDLKYEETLGYKLSQLAKRPVYNYAFQGKGFQNTYFMLQNKIYDTNIKKPEYFIYVMMSDHIRRLYSNVCMSDFVGQPVYKLKKDGTFILEKDYYPPYKQFFTYYYFNNLIYNAFISKDFDKHNKYVNAYFRAFNEEIKKQYPDIKFVILVYGDENNCGLDLSSLEKEGFTILQTNVITGVNLFDRKYRLSDTDMHPTAEAWEIIVPKLIDALKL